jgi:hypothetical protein
MSIVPDDRIAALRPVLDARIEEAATLMCGEGFGDFFDPQMRAVFCGCVAAGGAHEGTVWLLDQSHAALVPRFNTGPNAASFVNIFRQNLGTGLISTVVATEQPMCENAVDRNPLQDKTLDRKLGVQTSAMLATPFYFAGALRGVLSAVLLTRDGEPAPELSGFSTSALDKLQLNATILAQLIERRLLGLTLGLEDAR